MPAANPADTDRDPTPRFTRQSIPAAIAKGRTDCDCMNALQNHGIISDLCINWQDVGNKPAALKWLTDHPDET